MEGAKEEYAIVLDFLPNGYPFDKRPSHKKTPIAQAVGREHFTLLELVPKREIFLQPYEEVYIGEGKREKIHHISGSLPFEKLTVSARNELNYVVKEIVHKNEEKFVKFYNEAGPMSTRLHQLELIPGIGKKHMWELLEERKAAPFKSFDDIKKRVKLMPDPESGIIKRIMLELEGVEKRKIFVR
ncbi:DUF655 domain-containing protein [Candidatus Woesearchaeota archaeon]|nr:DUF655 domain-containing protein [Candidatus Woesearchaeota archaeon]